MEDRWIFLRLHRKNGLYEHLESNLVQLLLGIVPQMCKHTNAAFVKRLMYGNGLQFPLYNSPALCGNLRPQAAQTLKRVSGRVQVLFPKVRLLVA